MSLGTPDPLCYKILNLSPLPPPPPKSYMRTSSDNKGRTIRKVMGGRGIFSLHDFFFSPSACAGIFFAGETLCTNFFFSDKYCFVCRLRTHQLERARAGTRGFPRTSMRNGLLTGGRNNYFFLLNFSKSSRTTYVQIFAVDRKH